MNFRKNQAGFSAVELVIVLVVIGVLAFVGYTVYNRQQDNKAADSGTSQSATASDVPPAPEVKNTNDLDKASATLDQVNPGDDSDSSQLDSELNAF